MLRFSCLAAKCHIPGRCGFFSATARHWPARVSVPSRDTRNRGIWKIGAVGSPESRQAVPQLGTAHLPATPDSYWGPNQAGRGVTSVATRQSHRSATNFYLSLPQAKQRQGTDLCESCQSRDVTCHLPAWPMVSAPPPIARYCSPPFPELCSTFWYTIRANQP